MAYPSSITLPASPVAHPDPLVFDAWLALQAALPREANGRVEAGDTLPLHDLLDAWRVGKLPLKETRRRLDGLLAVFGLVEHEDNLVLGCLTGESGPGGSNTAPSFAGHLLLRQLSPHQPRLVSGDGDFNVLTHIAHRTPPKAVGLLHGTMALLLAHATPEERDRCLGKPDVDGDFLLGTAVRVGADRLARHLLDLCPEARCQTDIHGQSAFEVALATGQGPLLRTLVSRGWVPGFSILRQSLPRLAWTWVDHLGLGEQALLP